MRAGAARRTPLTDRELADGCERALHPEGTRRAPRWVGEPPPRPPAYDACRAVTASAHASVMPRPRSLTPAHICPQACASGIMLCDNIRSGFQGARSPLAARRAGDQPFSHDVLCVGDRHSSTSGEYLVIAAWHVVIPTPPPRRPRAGCLRRAERAAGIPAAPPPG
jgi:hypothetical protein